MNVLYSPRYLIDIGLHIFPTRKYQLVHARLVQEGVIAPRNVIEPEAAAWDDLALVHTREYLTKIRDGTLSPDDLAQLELPWSPEMVEGFRVMVGGTIEAARLAVEHGGIVAHIGGGLHHAFPNHGEGFCPFNDVAVAIRVLQREGVQRAAVIDLDVHHGNGTAFIFESDSSVFTFSMHQQYNYPMWKPRGSLDIGLIDGIGDADYHRQLEEALPAVMASNPECLFYLAGADPYEQDQLGGLRLTLDGLRARDRIVIDQARRNRLPMVIVLAGGYARRVEDTVAVHTATMKEAAR
ncbi:MAG TPA: histone deacetylase [Vicinamibacterales bacterium]|nr:histone deacetylase [Vicinamibacterales bacterium]